MKGLAQHGELKSLLLDGSTGFWDHLTVRTRQGRVDDVFMQRHCEESARARFPVRV